MKHLFYGLCLTAKLEWKVDLGKGRGIKKILGQWRLGSIRRSEGKGIGGLLDATMTAEIDGNTEV
jgi:hypothetical protein